MNHSILPYKIRLWFVIILILLGGGILFSSIIWIAFKLKWWLILLLAIILILPSFINWLNKKINNKFIDVISRLASLPIAVIHLLLQIIHPFITIFGTLLFVVLYSFGVPALILVCMINAGWLTLKYETFLFIVLAIGSILCSTFTIAKMFLLHSPIKNTGKHKYEYYRERLALYIIHPSNIVFFIYFFYLIYLVISSYLTIQNNDYLISKSVDDAILKAFLVFIAYTNMLNKSRESEMDAKIIMRDLLKLFGFSEKYN